MKSEGGERSVHNTDLFHLKVMLAMSIPILGLTMLIIFLQALRTCPHKIATQANLNLYNGSSQNDARFMKWGKITQLSIELFNAVLGAHALIGKLIFVTLSSPLKSFLPINLTISLPTDLNLSTCLSSLHTKPPSLWANGLRYSSILFEKY
mgnify:CR=1 FL=1